MINHEHQFIFIHIPKCAGTSIQRALGNQNTATVRQDQHGRLSEYCAKYGRELVESYFKFAVVRNPWDLEVSSYFFNRSVTVRYRTLDISQKLKHKFDRMAGKIEPSSNVRDIDMSPYWFQLVRFCKEHSFEEYIKSDFWFTDGTFSDFLKVDENLQVDYIIHLETLQQDFNEVCDRIGISRKQLPYTNRSKRTHYSQYYNDETRQLVKAHYRQEIEDFGYEFVQQPAVNASTKAHPSSPSAEHC